MIRFVLNGRSRFIEIAALGPDRRIVIMVKKDQALSATAYPLSHKELVEGIEEESVFGEFKTFEFPVAEIERFTGLSFPDLAEQDPLKAEGGESDQLREITVLDVIQLWWVGAY
ncbi:MAG: hypothetical protein P1U90_21220 [Akkermansiaceae bacterium]|nr:hypothetical protein [Akkermansiaceae bacterium]